MLLIVAMFEGNPSASVRFCRRCGRAEQRALWTLPVVAAPACFLGVFPLATMLGAAALSRLVLAIIDAPVDRTPILAALGGLSYGVATATALGRAYAARPEIT
ncbi:MAG TPA: hypothetical protein VI056_04755 [Candidatus Limnocylindria bacterium]